MYGYDFVIYTPRNKCLSLCLLYCIAALCYLQLIMVFSERIFLEDLRDILEVNVTIVMREGVSLKELS